MNEKKSVFDINKKFKIIYFKYDIQAYQIKNENRE